MNAPLLRVIPDTLQPMHPNKDDGTGVTARQLDHDVRESCGFRSRHVRSIAGDDLYQLWCCTMKGPRLP
jgi:hypothetical protein